MASGSRGRGSRARALAGAGAVGPHAVLDARLASLSASDLVAHLNARPNREYEFVQVALVLGARERRLAEAEAQIRAADEVVDSLRDEIRERERSAAEAEAEIRKAFETEARLQAEIRAWERGAAEAKARIQVEVSGRDRTAREEDHAGLDPSLQTTIAEVGDVPRPSPLRRIASPPARALQAELLNEGAEVGVVDVADLSSHEEAQVEDGRRDEDREVVSGKRKGPAATSEDKDADLDSYIITLRQRSRKLKLRGGSAFLAAESESESDKGTEDVLANPDDGIVPLENDLRESSLEIRDAPKAGTEIKVHGNQPEDPRMTFSTQEWGIGGEESKSEYQVAHATAPLENDLQESSPEIGDGLEARTEQGVDKREAKDPRTTCLAQEWGIGSDPEDGDEDLPRTKESESEKPVALEIVPHGNDMPNALPDNGQEARTNQRVGREHEVPKTTAYVQRMGDDGEMENDVGDISRALALGFAVKSFSKVDVNGCIISEKKGSPASMHTGARGIVPEVSKSRIPARTTDGLHKKGMFYKMVFKALKEKEKERTFDTPATAAASQPNFRCWLCAPLPLESVVMEGPDLGAPQK